MARCLIPASDAPRAARHWAQPLVSGGLTLMLSTGLVCGLFWLFGGSFVGPVPPRAVPFGLGALGVAALLVQDLAEAWATRLLARRAQAVTSSVLEVAP